jgi:hypothetical protein
MTSVLEKVAQAKAAAEERLSRGGGPRARFWKPKNGDNTVRIMPSWLNPTADSAYKAPDAVAFYDGQFWRQVAQHWNVSDDQKGPILCPKETPGLGGACPICEFVNELRQDKSDVQAQALVKEIRAKITYLLNVVDMKDALYTVDDVAEHANSRPDDDCPFAPGDTKVQIYAAPLTVYAAILGLITANKRDITLLDTGRDIVITRHPNKNPIKTRYTVVPDFDASSFEILGQLPALHQQGYLMGYDKMLDLLHDGVGGDFIAALPAGRAALPSDTTTTTVPDEVKQERSVVDLAAELAAATGS